MAEVWTTIATQDDPDTGHQAIEKGRAFRDNDDCLTRDACTQQAVNLAKTGLNQTYPSRVATGVKVRFFKPAFVKKVSFSYYVAKNGIGAVRTWSVVRFNNNAALETPIKDTNVSAYPAVVTDFDISSLPEGVYGAEIYAGHAGASGDTIQLRLPSGKLLADPLPSTVASDSNNLSALLFSTADWSSVSPPLPACDLLDATHLTADKGHTQDAARMFYNRDERLRRRSAVYAFSPQGSSYTFPSWQGFVLSKIHVPLHAEVLNLQVLLRTTAGGTAYAVIDCEEMQAEFPFANANVSEDASSTSATDEEVTVQVNLAPMRGKDATLRLWLTNSTAAKSTNCQIPWSMACTHHWSAQPLAGRQGLRPNWQDHPLAARSTGALLSSAWWRRMKFRDRELQERQLLQRAYSATIVTVPVVNSILYDSIVTLYQPKGMGATGGHLVVMHEIANTLALSNTIKLDYLDEPDGYHADVLGNVINGVYRLERLARADRDGTLQNFGVFVLGGRTGTIHRCQSTDLFRAGWRL